MYAITGATGQLGRLVIDTLITSVPPSKVIALARDPAKAADIAAKGVTVRTADYDRPDTLASALEGVDRLLLISSSELGKRVAQHQAVIDAAKAKGVTLLAYTSVLRADASALSVAVEHRATEEALAASGVPFVLLRNGWYTENYLASAPAALAHGAVLGSAGDGRISGATRQDYAEAAVAALTAEDSAGAIYELAGDEAWTLADYAAELSRQSGRTIAYRDLPQTAYEAALLEAGLPAPVAALLAQSDAAAANGALEDHSRTLSRLIGRPTTSLRDAVTAALR